MQKRERFKTAFIPGAGLGMRLRPLTEHCPKPLLNIGGRPMITYVMDHLIGVGIERFIVNTHHCPEVYLEKFPDCRWRDRLIIFCHESRLLDTAGGLKNIEDLLADDQSILCYNGDVFANFPLQPLIQDHIQHKAEATLALRSHGPALNVNINSLGEVCDLRSILRNPGIGKYLFTGIYALETSILRHIKSHEPETIITTFIQRILERRGSVRGLIIDEGDWTDVGSIQTYEQLKNSFQVQEGSIVSASQSA
jgi:mannose-1-phosphate guanylyltransferase